MTRGGAIQVIARTADATHTRRESLPAEGKGETHVQAVVIGGGVVGSALTRELARRGIEVLLLEAEPDVGEGASKANSGIVHTGFDAKPGSVEAALLRRAAGMWPETIEALGVPFLEVGALMLATSEGERDRLRTEIAGLAARHGVATELVDRAWLDACAPYVTPAAVAALHVPGEGVIDPFWLTRAYAESAIAMGAEVWTDAAVSRLEVGADEVVVGLADGRRVVGQQAFDAAGVRADEVAALAGDTTFRITPRKGQFLVSEKTFGVDRIVLPIPGPLGKGMLVTPIVFGGVLLGPTAEDIDDKTDRDTDTEGARRILRACRDLVPDVEHMEAIRQFAGVRAVSSTGDYIIRPSTMGDRLTIVAGIRSTGISASPAIAEAAADLALAARSWSSAPRRRATAAGPAWAEEAGPIVCVCRSVSTTEVEAALGGALPARTADAVKRRSGAGFGDCQGNGCLADVLARIAIASDTRPSGIRKGPVGSWIVADEAQTGAAAQAAGPLQRPHQPPSPPDGRSGVLDIVVIGGGMAGIGAALAAHEAGLRVLVVERRTASGGAVGMLPEALRAVAEADALAAFAQHVTGGAIGWWPSATVVGLRPGDGEWFVDIEDGGSHTAKAAHVLLATGGYFTPREHLELPGPRPSGVMTADFAESALDRGWLPGRAAVVTGAGRVADGLVRRLEDAGVHVVARAVDAGVAGIRHERAGHEEPRAHGATREHVVTAVRGFGRLDGVMVDGTWVEADTLVLAHAMRPATFLLRGLGIGDERPGVPAPAGSDGGLPLPGLWAAGTCRTVDVDHGRSLDAGRAVAARIAAAQLATALSAAAAAGAMTR